MLGKRMCWQYGINYTDLKQGLEKLVDDVWGKFVIDPKKNKSSVFSYGRRK